LGADASNPVVGGAPDGGRRIAARFVFFEEADEVFFSVCTDDGAACLLEPMAVVMRRR
jgi:hypothetical protein